MKKNSIDRLGSTQAAIFYWRADARERAKFRIISQVRHFCQVFLICQVAQKNPKNFVHFANSIF
jgi:hypothetical protein